MDIETITKLLDDMDIMLANMISEKQKNDQLFDKQISFLKMKYTKDIQKIDMQIDLYNKKYPTFRRYERHCNYK